MKIIEVKGVGKKVADQFARLGIEKTDDLVLFYPTRYEKMPCIKEADDAVVGETHAIKGQIQRLNIGAKCYYAYLEGTKQKIQLIWFQTEYLVEFLRPGTSFIFLGNIVEDQGQLQMKQPKVYTLEQYSEMEGSLQAVYPLTRGLRNTTVQRVVNEIIRDQTYPEILPEFLIKKFGLYSMDDAIIEIHQPANEVTTQKAHRRIVFNEFFMFLLTLHVQRDGTVPNRYPMTSSKITNQVEEKLPYSLTPGQKNAWADIKADLLGETPMRRILQGDVGCGKSVIAFLSLLQAAENNYQGALMAPTDVLARQHYQDIVGIIESNNLPYKAVLLTGGVSVKERSVLLGQIAAGEAKIIIGTHALIQNTVNYQMLGLVVTDESHRFGVMQRQALTLKGQSPHELIISATPVPRTMAMTLYADLNSSIIKDLPAHRLTIKNSVLDKTWRQNVWNFVKKEIDKGRQAYIICPMVEQNEDTDCENVRDYAVSFKGQFPDVESEILDWKMNQDEKDEVLQRFISGEIKVLISTTEIETGINVANASTIVIEDANSFGLSQLHQLRGRVGRGCNQSYCIFMSNSPEGKEKLEILAKTTDGFQVAEEDLRIRGVGESSGIRQSGDMNFNLTDVVRYFDILEEAAEAVRILSGIIMQTKKILNK